MTEEGLHVAAGDLGEVGTDLVRVQLAVLADGPQQRTRERTRSGAGLQHLRTGKHVPHRDDLAGVLGIDHLRTAWHRQDVVTEQRPQREVGGPAGRGHHRALGQSDQVIVAQRPTVSVKLLAGRQHDRVQATLRVGELHPVPGFERGHEFNTRARSAKRSTPTTSVPDTTR